MERTNSRPDPDAYTDPAGKGQSLCQSKSDQRRSNRDVYRHRFIDSQPVDYRWLCHERHSYQQH